MNYVLTLLFVAAIAVAAFRNLRSVAAVMVIFVALTPRYLVIPLGANLLPVRSILLAFIFTLCVVLLQQSHVVKKLLAARMRIASSLFWVAILVMLFSAVVSAYIGHTKNWSLLSLSYDFLNSVGVLIAIFVLAKDARSLHTLLMAVTVGLFISELLAVTEYLYQHTLLSGLIDASEISGTEFFADRSRDEQYRVRALFDNHLMLAEYVAVAWPLAWVVYCNNRAGTTKILALVSLLLTPLVLYLAGARSGWLICGIGVALLVFMQVRLKQGRYFRWLSNVMIMFVLVYLSYRVMDILSAPEQIATADDSAGASTLERVGQYLESFNLFMASPWLGYGKGLDLEGANFLMFIDSYVLVVLLEGGVLGLFIFIWLWALVLRHAAKLVRLSRYNLQDKNLALGLSVAGFSLLIFQFFISIPWNNVYIFVIEGLIVVQLHNLSSHHKIKEAKG